MTILDHPQHKTMDHAAITAIITDKGRIPYGVGIDPNPYVQYQKEWQRRHEHKEIIATIHAKIQSLFEPRFITPPETSELIAAIVTATDARRVLELGTCTGFTSLHILKALYGKENAKLVSIDSRPAHDREFWAKFPGVLEFVEGTTPQILSSLAGSFDVVFVDSDHSVEHTSKELGALWPITRSGTVFLFHDLPAWQSPQHPHPPEVRSYLLSKVADGTFTGFICPTCEQLDCVAQYGAGYPSQLNPHLGIFVRR